MTESKLPPLAPPQVFGPELSHDSKAGDVTWVTPEELNRLKAEGTTWGQTTTASTLPVGVNDPWEVTPEMLEARRPPVDPDADLPPLPDSPITDAIMMSHRSVVDRARAVVHAACLDPDVQRVLVREIAKAISDAEMRGIKYCQLLYKDVMR